MKRVSDGGRAAEADAITPASAYCRLRIRRDIETLYEHMADGAADLAVVEQLAANLRDLADHILACESHRLVGPIEPWTLR